MCRECIYMVYTFRVCKIGRKFRKEVASHGGCPLSDNNFACSTAVVLSSYHIGCCYTGQGNNDNKLFYFWPSSRPVVYKITRSRYIIYEVTRAAFGLLYWIGLISLLLTIPNSYFGRVLVLSSTRNIALLKGLRQNDGTKQNLCCMY